MVTRKFVLDTSLFVNPHAREKFGKSSNAALAAFIKLASNMDVEFYMPPAIFKELANFVKPKTLAEFELIIKKRAPNTFGIYLPAAVFYEFIDDIRTRMNKGMRLAEDFAINNHPDNDAKLRKLRDKYRDAMRSGILDSKEDFELVLLAKELEAALVSSDEGVVKFAHQIGCECVDAVRFHSLLTRMKKK
jgi:RNA ligase partner protein